MGGTDAGNSECRIQNAEIQNAETRRMQSANGGTRMTRVAAILLVAVISAPSIARAQGGSAVPLDKATVSKEVAQRTLMKNQISSTVARQLVDACVEFARNQQGGPGNYA